MNQMGWIGWGVILGDIEDDECIEEAEELVEEEGLDVEIGDSDVHGISVVVPASVTFAQPGKPQQLKCKAVNEDWDEQIRRVCNVLGFEDVNPIWLVMAEKE